METQRSFHFKPTRFLVFSFTISSSLLFLIFFFIFLIKLSPSFNQQTNFQFHDSPPSFPTIQSLTAQNGNLSSLEAKNSILSVGDVPKVSQVSSVQEGIEKESENLLDNSMQSHGYSSQSMNLFLDGVDNSSFEAINSSKSQEFDDIVNSSFSSLSSFTQSKNLSLDGVESSSLEANDIMNSNFTSLGSFTQSKNLFLDGVESSSLEANYSRKSQDFDVEEVKGTSTSVDVDSNSSEGLSGQILTSIEDKIEEKNGKSCDFARGGWVFDESYPLYTNVSCPFIDEGFDCLGNGRLDKEYMKWRWQPQGCDLPRFNATKMLELIRGKRLVFVGDSVNRNQWESLLCLLMGAIKDPKKVYETRGRRITKGKGNYSFKFVDYKCTVEFYVTHFLVHESKARIGRKRVQTLRIDTIDKGSSRWRGADILVFNTAHWWNHQKTKSGINYYQEKDQVLPRLDVSDAFRRALLTWASWVDKNIRSQRTQVFFRSSAPSHFSGGQWNSGGHCKEASRPLDSISDTNYPERNKVVEAIISQMRTPVTYLNITSLSDYRIDGHPSIYGRMAGKSYSSGGQDCSHWCLPGVPDTWNQILYSHLLFKGREGSN